MRVKNQCPEPWKSNADNDWRVLLIFFIFFVSLLITLLTLYANNESLSDALRTLWCFFPSSVYMLSFLLFVTFIMRKGDIWSLHLPSNTNLLRALDEKIENYLKEGSYPYERIESRNDEILQTYKIRANSATFQISIVSNWISFDIKKEEDKRSKFDDEEKDSSLRISNITSGNLAQVIQLQRDIMGILEALDYLSCIDDVY